MQHTHSIQLANDGKLQMNKAEVKRYVQENIIITFLIISSSPSYRSHIFFKFYTITVCFFLSFFLLNASGRVHSV